MYLQLLVTLIVAFISIYQGMSEVNNFSNLIKNVNTFIEDSRNVISILNYEIVKSNYTLDRIAVDSEKLNIASGEEENKIRALESQMENSEVIFPYNVGLREDEYARAREEGKLILESPFVKHKIISQSLIIPKNYSISKKIANESSSTLKEIMNKPNGSVCIVVQPIYCPDSTEPGNASNRTRVPFSNYDPFMDPPMKGVSILSTTTTTSSTTDAIMNAGTKHTKTENENDPNSSSPFLKTTTTVTSPDQTLEMEESPLRTGSPQENTSQSNSTEIKLINFSSAMSTFSTFPLNTKTYYGSVPSLNQEGLNNTRKQENITKTKVQLPYSTSEKNIKMGCWKSLFGKNKKRTSSTEYTPTINYIDISTEQKIQGNNQNTSRTPEKKPGALLILLYNIEKGKAKGTLNDNIESINLIRNKNNSLSSLIPTNIISRIEPDKSLVIDLELNKLTTDLPIQAFNQTIISSIEPHQNVASSALSDIKANIASDINSFYYENEHDVKSYNSKHVSNKNKTYKHILVAGLIKLLEELKNRNNCNPHFQREGRHIQKIASLKDVPQLASLIHSTSITPSDYLRFHNRVPLQVPRTTWKAHQEDSVNEPNDQISHETDATENIYIFSNQNQTVYPEVGCTDFTKSSLSKTKKDKGLKTLFLFSLPHFIKDWKNDKNCSLTLYKVGKTSDCQKKAPIKLIVLEKM